MGMMLVAVVALGILVVLKGIQSKRVEPPKEATASGSTKPEEIRQPDIQPRPLVTNVVATTPAEDHRASIEHDLDQIKDALLEGLANSNLVLVLREKLLSPEAEVRKAAVEVTMHINDREAIPKLKEALGRVEDTREKVAILDAIEYLQIPDSNAPMETGSDADAPSALGITNRPADPQK